MQLFILNDLFWAHRQAKHDKGRLPHARRHRTVRRRLDSVVLTTSAPRDQGLDIAETIERLVTQDGFELVVCEMKKLGRRHLLRVVVDHPNGITLDHCAALSRRIGDHLDAVDAVPTAYTLEVSSPGVERGLYRLADYQRFTGHRVRLRTTVALNGRRQFRGRIAAVRTEEGRSSSCATRLVWKPPLRFPILPSPTRSHGRRPLSRGGSKTCRT